MNNQLIKDQMGNKRIVVHLPPARSVFHRAVAMIADLVLGLLTIAVIAMVTIWAWESYRPRVVVLISPPAAAPAQKSCGVAV